MNVVLGQPGSLGIGTGRTPNSGLTASSQRTTESAVYAADLARAGLYSSPAGKLCEFHLNSSNISEIYIELVFICLL